MKKYTLILLLLVTVLLHSCSDDQIGSSSKSKTKVTFSLDERTSAEIPDGSSMIISIRTTSGAEIYVDHGLTLSRKNGVLLSESVTVDAGQFEITEFLVLHDDAVIYASPKVGSVMAGEVSMPLSRKFVASDLPETVPVEVVNVKDADAGKFGYSSFKKRPKNIFQIVVSYYDNGIKTPMSSYLQIENQDTAFYYYLNAGANTLTFGGDPNATYTLTAYRPGFYRKSVEFNLKRLKGKENVIDLVLEFTDPADVAKLVATDIAVDFTLGMVGVGCLRAEYGNSGQAQYGEFPANATIITPPDTSYMYFTGGEVSAIYDIIEISGDLDQVVSLETKSSVNAVELERMPNLAKLTIRGSGLPTLDLTVNPGLRNLSLVNSGVSDLILQDNPQLAGIYLDHVYSGVNDIITAVHDNAVAHNITGGSITLIGVTLSASSNEMLTDLQSSYNWSVTVIDQP